MSTKSQISQYPCLILFVLPRHQTEIQRKLICQPHPDCLFPAKEFFLNSLFPQTSKQRPDCMSKVRRYRFQRIGNSTRCITNYIRDWTLVPILLTRKIAHQSTANLATGKEPTTLLQPRSRQPLLQPRSRQPLLQPRSRQPLLQPRSRQTCYNQGADNLCYNQGADKLATTKEPTTFATTKEPTNLLQPRSRQTCYNQGVVIGSLLQLNHFVCLLNKIGTEMYRPTVHDL